MVPPYDSKKLMILKNDGISCCSKIDKACCACYHFYFIRKNDGIQQKQQWEISHKKRFPLKICGERKSKRNNVRVK